MKLHVLSGGTLRVNKGVFTPGRDEGKQLVVPVLCFLIRENLDEEIVPRNTWSAPALLDSLRELRRWQARGALLIVGHDPEQWAGLRKGPDAYE